MVLRCRRPRTVLGCLVACRGPVRLPGLGAGWLPGASWGGRFPGCGPGRRCGPGSAPGLAVPPPPGRAGSLSRVSWPGGRARVARSPALPRGARSPSGDAPAAGRASAAPPTGRCKRGRRRSLPGPRSHVIWVSRSRNFPVGIPETARRNARPRRPREGRFPCRSRPSARASAKSRSSITTARAPWSFAVAIRPLTAARSRPSRVVAGSPGSPGSPASGTVNGTPRTFPSAATTATARWPAFTSTATTGYLPEFLQRRDRVRGGLPRPVEVPAPRSGVAADVVADRTGGGLGGDLIAPVGEPDRARQPVAAVRPVRQVRQRGGSSTSSQPSSGLNLIVSLPHAFPASPSAVRNSRAASHLARHCSSVSPAAARFAPLAQQRPPHPRHRHRPPPPPGARPGPAGPAAPGAGCPWHAAPPQSRTRATCPRPAAGRHGEPRLDPPGPRPQAGPLRGQVLHGEPVLVLAGPGDRPRPPRGATPRSAPASARPATPPAPGRPAAPPRTAPPGHARPATPGATPPPAAPPRPAPIPAAACGPAPPPGQPPRTDQRSGAARPPGTPSARSCSITNTDNATIRTLLCLLAHARVGSSFNPARAD